MGDFNIFYASVILAHNFPFVPLGVFEDPKLTQGCNIFAFLTLFKFAWPIQNLFLAASGGDAQHCNECNGSECLFHLLDVFGLLLLY